MCLRIVCSSHELVPLHVASSAGSRQLLSVDYCFGVRSCFDHLDASVFVVVYPVTGLIIPGGSLRYECKKEYPPSVCVLVFIFSLMGVLVCSRLSH